MLNKNGLYPKLVMLIFILQVALNWLYVLWVKNQTDIIVNAWFALIPFFGFFYFTFTLLSLAGLYYRLKQGLALAAAVILFGAICTVISYELAFKSHRLIDITLIPLLILNACSLIFIAFNLKYFQSE